MPAIFRGLGKDAELEAEAALSAQADRASRRAETKARRIAAAIMAMRQGKKA
jgi:hypothetical protein